MAMNALRRRREEEMNGIERRPRVNTFVERGVVPVAQERKSGKGPREKWKYQHGKREEVGLIQHPNQI